VASNNITEAGFVYCPVCEYSYTDSKAAALADNRVLVPAHIAAQASRCNFFEGEIGKLESALDVMITEAPLPLAENEKSLAWILESDLSSVSDESGVEGGDYLAFASTEYALLAGRMSALKARRNLLVATKNEKLELGAKLRAPWAKDASWGPEAASEEGQLVLARNLRRAKRRTERAVRYQTRASTDGASKVIHNVHVLGKNVPRKWREADPNANPAGDSELKALDKKGWLNEQELEELDDDEQAAVTEKRREVWLSQQSRVPKIFGSEKRQRWANRLYRIARRNHYFGERIEGLGGDESQVMQWRTLLQAHAQRLTQTEIKCELRLSSLEAAGRYETAGKLRALFQEATAIGAKEIADELAARAAALAASIAAEAAAAEVAAKAEEKLRLKAEAEARGETYVDPDADNEGDGEEEED
jgi:hypothetical protein